MKAISCFCEAIGAGGALDPRQVTPLAVTTPANVPRGHYGKVSSDSQHLLHTSIQPLVSPTEKASAQLGNKSKIK